MYDCTKAHSSIDSTYKNAFLYTKKEDGKNDVKVFITIDKIATNTIAISADSIFIQT